MRKVVVTGMGIVIGHGQEVEEVWTRIRAGESGTHRIQSFDPSGLDTQMAAEVRYRINCPDAIGPYPMDAPALRMAAKAGSDALGQAGLDNSQPSHRRAVFLATGVGPPALEGFGHLSIDFYKPGDNLRKTDLTPFFPQVQAHAIADTLDSFRIDRAPRALAWMMGARQLLDTASACASGSHALAEAGKFIRRDEADVVLAGGVCTAINRV